MKTKTLMVLASLVLMLALAGSAYASVAYYEGFNYTVGTSLVANGYVNLSNGSTPAIQAGSVAYTDLATSGNKAYAAPGPTSVSVLGVLPTAATALFQNAGTFYMSMLLNGDVEASVVVLDNHAAPTGVAGWTDELLQAHLDGWGEYAWRFLAGGNDSSPSYNAVGSQGPHLYTFKIVNDGTAAADTFQMAVDPVLSAGEPISWTYTHTVNITGNTDGIYLNMNWRGVNQIDPDPTYVDEIRIATTWAEVVPVPEPGSILALAAGLVSLGGMTLRRRTR